MMKEIIEKSKWAFLGYFDDEHYIEIQYVGWKKGGVKKYKTKIYRDECGCIYEEIKDFPNINEAILYAVYYLNLI